MEIKDFHTFAEKEIPQPLPPSIGVFCCCKCSCSKKPKRKGPLTHNPFRPTFFLILLALSMNLGPPYSSQFSIFFSLFFNSKFLYNFCINQTLRGLRFFNSRSRLENNIIICTGGKILKSYNVLRMFRGNCS